MIDSKRRVVEKMKKKDVYSDIEEKVINRYPGFLRDYYYSAKETRETKIRDFYSTIPANSLILEGACGKVSRIREFNAGTTNIKELVGVDLAASSVRLNTDLDFKVVGNLEHLPFKKNYYDVVHLSNVVEHLTYPLKVFEEASFVLKKGGILLISTKNILNPFMCINMLLPLGLRYWVKKNILKSPAHHLDTFPAPYKCNSKRKMKAVLSDMGFEEEEVWLWGWPLIITPSIGLFVSMIYEKLTDKEWLRFSKPNIYARFRKISDR